MRLAFIFVVSILLQVHAADPNFPNAEWPTVWHTWVVNTISDENQGILHNKGQLIAFDGVNGYACRYNQQNLLNITTQRSLDVCDFEEGFHWLMNDTTPASKCAGSLPLSGTMSGIKWPAEFLKSQRFVGVDKVNQLQCNHWLALRVNISGIVAQMDVWTAVSTGFPCQIHISPTGSKQHHTWAFDGFAALIPPTAKDACGAAKIMCSEADYKCQAKASASPLQLAQALEWVCDPSRIDCSPISPGGEYFEPDTLTAHASWAFNQYYLMFRESQGPGACNFGGAAELVKPTPTPSVVRSRLSRGADPTDVPVVFLNDLVCPPPDTL